MPTPRDQQYRMPAEWDSHEATWLSWPTDPDTFPPEIIDQVEEVYIQMIQALREGEKVYVLVDDKKTQERIEKKMGIHPHVLYPCIKTQDVWIRDYGPTFVTQQGAPPPGPTKQGTQRTSTKSYFSAGAPRVPGLRTGMIPWHYNAYGEKYDELKADGHVPKAMNKILRLPTFEPDIIMEGGAIEVNGQGLCLTTEMCLLNKNRNPHLGQKNIEALLGDYLNVDRILWLKHGIVGDDTDGHIDNLARFVSPHKIVYCLEEDPQDENYESLQKNLSDLKTMSKGLNLEIIPLPMPGHVSNKKSGRLPASYANFYIANEVVLVPLYHQPNDKRVLSLFSDLFPQRKIVGIHATPLVWGFGSIHCVTQQQPA